MLVAGDDDRASADLRTIKIERVANLRFMAEIDPSSFEDVLQFHLEEIGVGINVAVNAEDTLLGIVHDVL